MVNFGYPYNDLVICKDSTDYLPKIQPYSRYVNRFFYGPFILRRHFKENSRMTFQTEIDKKFCDTCQI